MANDPGNNNASQLTLDEQLLVETVYSEVEADNGSEAEDTTEE